MVEESKKMVKVTKENLANKESGLRELVVRPRSSLPLHNSSTNRFAISFPSGADAGEERRGRQGRF